MVCSFGRDLLVNLELLLKNMETPIFSENFDSITREDMIVIGKIVATNERAELKAANLPITFSVDNQIIKEMLSGEKNVIGEVPSRVSYNRRIVIKLD